jgi:hypothetical protein
MLLDKLEEEDTCMSYAYDMHVSSSAPTFMLLDKLHKPALYASAVYYASSS